jgi:hypothetical protein
MNDQYPQALAAMPVGDIEYILSRLRKTDDSAVQTNSIDDDAGSGQAEEDEENRRRRHIEREWPEAGVILTSEYYGAAYAAEVIPAAKKLKSGRQIRITSGPARGVVCDSFSEAMIAATEKQRADQNLARKGVSNGWLFWDWPGKPECIAGGSADDRDED